MVCEGHCSIDVVMEGGGVKGMALVGALATLQDRGYRWINMAGTSAGAIAATLMTAGYTAYELRDILTDLDFRRFLDGGPRWLPPKTRAAYNLAAHWGIHRGDRFLAWIRELLAAKGVRTFADLKRGIPDRDQVYRVRCVASDVTRGKMLILPEDIADYGVDPDELDVGLAVRMSMSIPGFFRPVTMHAEDPEKPLLGDTVAGFRRDKTPCYIVDGALLSNFPIQLFDGPGMDERPTFGLRLTNHGAPPITKFRARSLVTYAMAMVGTATSAHDSYYLDTHTFLRTIEIDSLGISPIKFELTRSEKAALYDAGCEAAREFLSTWDFDLWKKAYNEHNQLGRRRLLRKALES